MVFPRIKADLEALNDLPTSMLEESTNIQEIINITQTLEKYGEKEGIDSGFIQHFRNKLSRENRRWVTMKKIDNYDDFVAALYEKVYRNQFTVKTDGFPPKAKKKSCCLCK